MSKIYYYAGCMNSIKTGQLICTAYNYREKGMTPIILTSAKDKRSGINKVKSRIEGLEYKAISIKDSDNLFEVIGNVSETLEYKIDVVLVDEVQFFTPAQIDQLTDIVDFIDIPVLCYGIKTDFRQKGFPASIRLLEVADEIIKLKSMCSCGRAAGVNARIENGKIVTEGNQIQIGGNESYTAMCRRCWKLSLSK